MVASLFDMFSQPDLSHFCYHGVTLNAWQMAGIVVAINKIRMIADFSLLKDTQVPKEQEIDTNLQYYHHCLSIQVEELARNKLLTQFP